MIDSVKKINRDGENSLVARHFVPWELARMSPEPLHDLTRPAFAMQSPHITFVEALKAPRCNEKCNEYKEFADSYSLTGPNLQLEQLHKLRKHGLDEMQIDARIAELIRMAMDEAQRIASVKVRICGNGAGLQRSNVEDEIEVARQEGLQGMFSVL